MFLQNRNHFVMKSFNFPFIGKKAINKKKNNVKGAKVLHDMFVSFYFDINFVKSHQNNYRHRLLIVVLSFDRKQINWYVCRKKTK
jgi:hypothetical protein